MTYWLDLFTGTTWNEFLKAGGTISGFRESKRGVCRSVQTGDIFICYLTGVMRWVGALEVIGPSSGTRRIWEGDAFPVRFEVRPLITLTPEDGVPMEQFEGRVCFYSGPKDRPGFQGFLRGSPNRFKSVKDAELILSAIRDAHANPVSRPVDPKKLAKQPYYSVERQRGGRKVSTVVTVPEPDDTPQPTVDETSSNGESPSTRHTEMQYELLKLGGELGLDVWVARNDRSKKWNGVTLGSMPGTISELPTQFNDATTRTIELIDVLWLKGNTIVAAFEVECTTSIYSGLLRMSDLLSLQPNLQIDLFLVAPDERKDKVEQELLRPTFNIKEKPLASTCGFLGFTRLFDHISGIRKLGLAASLQPTFLKKTAEFFGEAKRDGNAFAARA